ncbi:MAG: class I SAM-dependent methyltransferase [Bacteroidales bacterium]
MNKEIWNKRYSNTGYVYGTEPNQFFRQQLDLLTPGKILLPGEGEGRQAVYAARKGWDVTAFDQSEVAQGKANLLAARFGVRFNYFVAGIDEASLPEESFDVLALIFVHTPYGVRKEFHRSLLRYLKPGGVVILEAFSKEQLAYTSGGPKDEEMLFSIEEMEKDFKHIHLINLHKEIILLEEGNAHKGEASVIRLLGRK